MVSNKLWWEFWPEQSAAAELDGSLARMGFDYVDLIYANPPPDGLPVAEMVAAVGELVAVGQGARVGHRQLGGRPVPGGGRAPPRSRVSRSRAPHSSRTASSVATGSRATRWPRRSTPRAPGVVASFVMAGGVLTGKYDAGQTRAAPTARSTIPGSPPRASKGTRLRTLAAELGRAPAALAIAFALANPAVATVLFGATSPAQIAENVTALEVSPAAVQRLVPD